MTITPCSFQVRPESRLKYPRAGYAGIRGFEPLPTPLEGIILVQLN
jgi:hypothetical protein